MVELRLGRVWGRGELRLGVAMAPKPGVSSQVLSVLVTRRGTGWEGGCRHTLREALGNSLSGQ